MITGSLNVVPYRALGNRMRLLGERLVGTPDGELGLRRATHVVAMAHVASAAYDKGESGMFSRSLLDLVAARLDSAQLQPEESRFRDILEWGKVDRPQIRRELRSNLDRLLPEAPSSCVLLGLELHILLELYMRREPDYLRVIDGDDIAGSMVMQHAFAAVIGSIPELFGFERSTHLSLRNAA
jgi:hypothetical protein